MAVNIQVKDDATPLLRDITAKLKSGAIENAMGRAHNVVVAHLRRINQQRPNALGGKRSNFYSAAADSTHYTARIGQIDIDVEKIGVRQRLQGGEIRARNVKYLTIPATAEAHAKRAGEFANLKFGFAENKFGALMPALIAGDRGRKRRGTATPGKVMYFLTPRVFQKGDPTVMPTEAEVIAGATRAADAFLRLKGAT